MDYSLRLANTQKLLLEFQVPALLIEDPINLLYLTGMELSAGKLLISAQDSALIVDGRYFESCSQQKLFPVLKLDPDSLKSWLFSYSIESLAFDSDTTTYQGYINLKQITDTLTVNPVQLFPIPSPLAKLRLIKDAEEIELLRAAGNLCYQGYLAISKNLEMGITEEDLATQVEQFWRSQGAKKVSFDPIIAFGENGSMPHYRAGKTTLQPNTSILIDIGISLQHYHSDMTRVVYFGKPQAEIEKIYKIVEEAKAQALALCRPGILIGDLDKVARSWITTQGYGDYFTHSLGHGVGLEIHEAPTIRSKGPYAEIALEEGMVITIEPGIYLPGVGGVRLEDTLLITKTGYEILTQ